MQNFLKRVGYFCLGNIVIGTAVAGVILCLPVIILLFCLMCCSEKAGMRALEEIVHAMLKVFKVGAKYYAKAWSCEQSDSLPETTPLIARKGKLLLPPSILLPRSAFIYEIIETHQHHASPISMPITRHPEYDAARAISINSTQDNPDSDYSSTSPSLV